MLYMDLQAKDEVVWVKDLVAVEHDSAHSVVDAASANAMPDIIVDNAPQQDTSGSDNNSKDDENSDDDDDGNDCNLTGSNDDSDDDGGSDVHSGGLTWGRRHQRQ
ncbi:hypothetical protein GUJ93_ZPchr0002g24487 [Zizania palustris]|uniref:Uncharacterized protein n=1 Tax=Zizania palustris TaxID=103762 RepID=A0A8J5RSQ5_ZIZPA|nr:hypothetical protein GUJ93_ZPchr0002g24487 [Zizania palustris]